MPPQPTLTQIRLNNITTCLTITANTLEILVGSLESPFLEAISNTTQSLLKNMETVKRNKIECTQLLEQTYELLNAILMVHINSNTGAELPPSVLTHIGKFTETLYKIHTFVKAQQNSSKFKNFFHQGEMSTLLKDCKAGLQQGFGIFQRCRKMQKDAEKRHKEVLDMIEALSDTTSSDRASSISRLYSGSHNSSNSISMLPSEPKIFHGRNSELSDILHLFSQGTPKIAILGAGGMGKTSLARAVIHHTVIIERYNQHRLFVACDSAATQVDLAALIGAHVGLKPGKDLTHSVIQYFSSISNSLLILDNLETLWEPVESRGKIEEFLSLLTGVDHLTLVITMRGAERPAGVAWTHPFLPALKPLEQDAACQTFIDIADNTHDSKEVDKVLSLTDNLPLAINLVAHLVESMGCSHVLSHWEEEKTSLISNGYDRTSNLDLSISLSLSSPRLNPHAKDLLSLLSMLPDGLSDVELVQSKLPIDNILGCKASLIRTTLAYSDEHKRLKALVPIRENYLSSSSNTVELNQVLAQLLEYYQTIQTYKIRRIGQGTTSLIQQIHHVLPYPRDHHLEAYFITELLNSWDPHSVSNIDPLVSDAQEHFKEFDDPDLKYHYQIKGDMSSATKFCEAAISLAHTTGNTKQHCQGLRNLAWIERNIGDYSAAQVHAKEAQQLAIISADLYREALALNIEATCCYTLGNYTKAMSLCIRARNLLVLCGMSHGSLNHGIMATQAEVHRLKSEYVEARSIHISILEETTIQDPYTYGWALLNVAEIDVMIGAPKDDVQRNCGRARKMLDPSDFYLREGNSLAAKTILAGCLKVTLECSQVQTYCLERLGDSSCWGDLDGMSSWTFIYLVNSLKTKEKLGIYKAL
ncbi:P-loop containing nucleoside triphosphate hydrolase protein [Mycena leptocephala]|nr:P-loop containing nucleoside triphosphate hydrolase protein [Mycena leptocephala]